MQNPILKQNNLFPAPDQIKAVRAYIKETRQTLSRSHKHILESARDPKIDHVPSKPWPIYISPKEDVEVIKKSLEKAISKEEFEQIEIRVLPAEVEQIKEHGLLYLPHDYVVPGGRFN